MFLKIRLPQALPHIFTGLKVGAALAATAAVVAEFVASDKGLGYLLLQYNGQLDTPMVFATIVLLSLIGLVVYYAVEIVERIAIPWHVSQQATAEGRDAVIDHEARERAMHSSRRSHDAFARDLLSPPLSRLAPRPLARAQDKVSLRLNWYLGGLHVPFYYGKDRGFYAAEGIDLTINEGRGSANTVQVVAAGSDTFGLADSSSVVLTAAKGADIKCVMSLLNTTGFSVVSLAETEHQDAEGPRRQEGRGDARRPARPAAAGACARRTTSTAARSRWCRSTRRRRSSPCSRRRPTRCSAAPTTSTS